jgi:hypothetical protein
MQYLTSNVADVTYVNLDDASKHSGANLSERGLEDFS